jgi:hypothetical protein
MKYVYGHEGDRRDILMQKIAVENDQNMIDYVVSDALVAGEGAHRCPFPYDSCSVHLAIVECHIAVGSSKKDDVGHDAK